MIMAKIVLNSPGYGFNVLSGQVTDMAEAGIWDSAAVSKTIVERAISGATLALTTDVLVHHKSPQQAMEP